MSTIANAVLEKFLQVFVCNNVSRYIIIHPGQEETVVTKTNQ